MAHKEFHQKKKIRQKKEANEHILKLFELAQKDFPSEISKNAIKTATQYSSKYKAIIPQELKRSFCKNCYTLLVPGKTAQIRFKKGERIRIITCLECGQIKRIKF